MSSGYVRTTILNYMTLNWVATPFYNLSDYIGTTDLNIATLNPWVGIQFLDAEETFAGVGNNCFREEGIIVFHVVIVAGSPSIVAINLCETLRSLYRGLVIGGDIYIDNIDPPTDQKGEALEFSGNWHGFAIYMDYRRDFDI